MKFFFESGAIYLKILSLQVFADDHLVSSLWQWHAGLSGERDFLLQEMDGRPREKCVRVCLIVLSSLIVINNYVCDDSPEIIARPIYNLKQLEFLSYYVYEIL